MLSRRRAGFLLFGGLCLIGLHRLRAAQDRAPSRREFTLSAREYSFSPDRIEVAHDDLVKVTVRSEDRAYSFTIDEYRIAKRVPAGGITTFEFRADRPGTFSFYCNLAEPACNNMRGTLVVRSK